MRFIVTGAPRSATQYAAKLLSACGVPCSHEGTLRPLTSVVDCLRWYRKSSGGESSWMAWALLSLFPEPVPVLHTVRDPWRTIDSMAHRNGIVALGQFVTPVMNSLRDMLAVFCPRVWEYGARIDRAAAIVVDWNKAIEKAVPAELLFSYCAEGLTPGIVKQALRHIGVERDEATIAKALEAVARDTNAGMSVTELPPANGQVVRGADATRAALARLLSRNIKKRPDRLSKQELAERMDPELLVEVNEHAERWGYSTAEQLTAVA